MAEPLPRILLMLETNPGGVDAPPAVRRQRLAQITRTGIREWGLKYEKPARPHIKQTGIVRGRRQSPTIHLDHPVPPGHGDHSSSGTEPDATDRHQPHQFPGPTLLPRI